MSLFLKVWGYPILIGFLSIFGLLSALIGDDMWDVLSWFALGVPVVLMGWFMLYKRRNQNQE